MSDIHAVTKFESLPNEILIECFEYLNAVDIFHSFDFLNTRFHNLIRSIPLSFNLEGIDESKLVQFCVKMLLNPQIKNQIRSVKLSYNERFDGLQILFSFVSLNDFPQLQVLILSDLDRRTISRIWSILPSLTNLRHFRLADSLFGINEIFESLATTTVQTLSMPKLSDNTSLTLSFIFLVNLTISSCYVGSLCYFFKSSPGLQSLDVKHLLQSHHTTVDQLQIPNDQAVRLKRLVLSNCDAEFNILEMLLQRTPNVTFLLISADDNLDIVDARRWRKLIRTSLILLDIFKFHFSCDIDDEDHGIIDKFQQFQTDFWHRQHHWHIEYVVSNDRALLYTVPYISNEYQMRPGTKRYYDKSFNTTNVFANVTDLTLYIEAMTNNDEYYFPYVNSVKLNNVRGDANENYPFLKMKHIQCLQTMVNLYNVTHLEISSECRWKSSSVMLQFLKEAVSLSSLKINKNTLFVMFKNRELCQCLNKMIRKLNIVGTDRDSCLNLDEIGKVCEIFSNMEEFHCCVGGSTDLEATLDHLSKLTYMKLFSYRTLYFASWRDRLRWHESELDLYSFTVQLESAHSSDDMFDSDPDQHDYDSD